MGLGPRVKARKTGPKTGLKPGRSPDSQRWWIAGHGFADLNPQDYRSEGGTWFVSFPPGPVLFYLPTVLFGLPPIPDIPLTWLLAALVAPLLDRCWQKPPFSLQARYRAALALAFVCATPLASIAIQGQVWFLAQVTFVVASCLSLWVYAEYKSAGGAGLAAAWALCCRPSAALGLCAAMVFWIFWTSTETAPSKSLRRRQVFTFLFPVAAAALALALFNYLRFGDPLEFGHRFLQVRWSQRILEQGLFSFDYLPRNLSAWLWLGPRWSGRHGFPQVSIHGLGWLWSCLWLFLWPLYLASKTLAIRKKTLSLGFSLAFVLALAPALAYQNSGQLQWSYRFGVDALPLLAMAIACAYPAYPRHPGHPGSSTPALQQQRGAKRGALGLCIAILLATALQLYGAWMWRHRPGHLFVSDPRGWPFEEEFSSNKRGPG